jgi:hypothetical protein
MINYGATIRKDPNTIPNGVLISDVANFYTNTKPTTRVDGTALVVGDLWKKVGQDLAEWDGTQWVGDLQSQLVFSVGSINSSTSSSSSFFPLGNKIVLKKFEATGRVDGSSPNPATDYWSFAITRSNGGGAGSLPLPVSVNNQNVAYTANRNLALSVTTNQVIDFSGAINNSELTRGFFVSWTKFGAAPNCASITFSIQYRIVYE